MQKDEPIEYPIDGTLDLHHFRPKDVKELIPEYIQVCREKQIYNIRIIHGKGTGQLKRFVYTILSKEPHVLAYRPAGEGSGSWGATLVDLLPIDGEN